MVHFDLLFHIHMKHLCRVYKENKLANGFLIRHFSNPKTVCPEHKKGRSTRNGLKLKRGCFLLLLLSAALLLEHLLKLFRRNAHGAALGSRGF